MNPTSRHVAGAASLLGPLLLLASTVAYIAGGDGMSEGTAAGAVQVWAFVVLGIALVGCAQLLDVSAPRGATLLSVVGIVGAVGGALYGLDAIQVAVLDGSIHESGASPIALRTPGLFFPLALLVLGALAARDGRVPRPAVGALVAAAVLFPIGRIADVEAVAIVTDVLLVGALGATAHALGASMGVAQRSVKPV